MFQHPARQLLLGQELNLRMEALLLWWYLMLRMSPGRLPRDNQGENPRQSG